MNARKTLLLLGAGVEQLAAIDSCKRFGIRCVAVDGNASAEGLRRADVGVHADLRDVEALVTIGRDHGVDGVFTHAVEIPPIVGRVAEILGLPGIPVDVAERATDKALRLEAFASAGVRCPAFRRIEEESELEAAAATMPFPLVLKPVDAAGARGVRKVDRAEDLPDAYRWATANSRRRTTLLEEFLIGPEISTEHVIVDGRVVTTGFADRNYARKADFEPFFIEDGHTIPSTLSPSEVSAIVTECERAIRAIGITRGVAKGDVLLAPDGPRILEMAARTSGGRFCSDMVPIATGVRILDFLVQQAVGISPSEALLEATCARGAAQRFFLPTPGPLRAVEGLEELRAMDGFYDLVVHDGLGPGFVVPPLRSHADRVGYVIFEGADRDEAVARAERAIASVRFVYAAEAR